MPDRQITVISEIIKKAIILLAICMALLMLNHNPLFSPGKFEAQSVACSNGIFYWDNSTECNITSARTCENAIITFECPINITSNLTTYNVTWRSNQTADNQYGISISDGGKWQSYNDTFQNETGGNSGYDYFIKTYSGGWVNLSSVENCYDDLNVYCYDGSTCYIDDYYGNSECYQGTWHFYAQSNTTLKDIYFKYTYLNIDSTESPAIYNFDAGSSSVSGNMTTENNIVKWIASKGGYWQLEVLSGATGTINLTESNPAYIKDIRTQRLNVVNSSIQVNSHLKGSPSEVACKNSDFGDAYYDSGYKSKIWSVGGTICTLGQMRTYDQHHADFSGYLDIADFWHISGTFYFNRTYPICAYSDTGITNIGSGYNISLYCWNTSNTEGSAITNSNGCVNIKIANMNQSWDNYKFEIRVNGTAYKNITVWQDSTETDGNGNLVGFEVENVSTGANIPPSISSLSISPATVYTNTQTVYCNFTITDPDGDTMNVNATWYNGTNLLKKCVWTSQSSGTSLSCNTMNYTLWAKGDVLNCSVRVNDGNDTTTDSVTKTVSDSPSSISVSLIYPTGNINVTQNHWFNVTVKWNCTDADGDSCNITEYLDPTNPNATMIEHYGNGRTFKAVVDSGYLYIGAGAELRIYNVSTDSQAFSLNTSSTPLFLYTVGGAIYGIDIDNNVIGVAGSRKVYFFNQTDMNNITLLGTWNQTDTYYDVVVSGNYAYVGAGSSGLKILDISDFSNIGLVGSVSAVASIVQLTSDSNYAFVCGNPSMSSSDYITAINTTIKSSPAIMSYFDGNATISDISVKEDDNMVFAVEYHHGVWSLNWTDKSSNATVLDFYGDHSTLDENFARMDYDSSDKTLYVSERYIGYVRLNATDITNLTKMYEAGGFEGTWGYAEEISHWENITVECSSTRGCKIYNTTELNEETEIETIGEIYGIHVQGDYLYIAPRNGPTWAIDVSDPTDIGYASHVAGMDSRQYTIDIADSDYMYILSSGGLWGHNITNAPNMVNMFSEWQDDSGTGMIVDKYDNNTLYMSCTYGGDGGLCIVNITNKSSPTLINFSSSIDGEPLNVIPSMAQYNQDIIVVLRCPVSNDCSMYAINVSDKTKPTLKGMNKSGLNAFYGEQIKISGDIAYTGYHENNCFVSWNLSQLSEPGNNKNITKIDSICYPGVCGIGDIEISGNYAYVLGDSGKYKRMIFDISDPTNLTEMWTSTDFTSNGEDGFIVGGCWYVGTANTGIEVWDIGNCILSKGLVSTTAGATPFWTNATSNPRTVSVSTSSLYTSVWWVNATGDVNDSYEFYIYGKLTDDASVTAETGKFNVTILEAENSTSDPVLKFKPPTEPNGTTVKRNWTEINMTIDEPNLDAFDFDWDYTEPDDYLVGYWRFDNNSEYGENNTHCYDYSGTGNNGTIYGKPTNWWNDEWKYRKKITITNNNDTSLTAGNPVNFSIDTKSLISAGKMLPNGNDLRIVYGTTEINRTNSTAFNSTSTMIWFNAQATIENGTSDSSYYVYYGNPNAGTPETGGITTVQNYNLSVSLGTENQIRARYVEGKKQLGLEFDGIDDYVSVPDDNSLDITGELTIEAWINCHNATTDHWGITVIRKQSNYILALKDAGNGPYVKFYLWGEEYNSGSLISGIFSLNEWVHVVATYNKSKMKVYLNGALSNTKDFSQTLRTSGYILGIGKEIGDSTWFDGIIDEVRIYNKSLSAEEIKQRYLSTRARYYDDSLVLAMNFNNNSAIGENSTYAVDISKYGNNGTIHGATWTTGKFGSALYFDGTNDYVEVPNSSSIDITDPITIEAWINVLSGTSGHIVSKKSDSGTQYVFYTISGYLKLYGTSGNLAYNANIDDDQWHHVVGIINGADSKMYLDGNLVQTGTVTSSNNPTAHLYIGTCYTFEPACFFDGKIDEVRIYNRALSEDEIKMHYLSEFQKYNSTQWRFYNNLTDLEDGTYTYYGWANDTAGNEGESEVREVTIDTTQPTISNEAINDTKIYIGESIYLNCSVTDNIEVDTVKFYIEPFGNLTASNINSEYYIICNATNPCNTNKAGQYTWTSVWANDTANNVNTTTVGLSYTVVSPRKPIVNIVELLRRRR